MTLYAESSAVLRWLFNEPAGAAVLGHLRTATKVVCSRLTLVETRRTILRAVSEARLEETHATDVLGTLSQAAARWAVLEVSRDVATRAEGRFPVEPVRTLDALHLASALVLRQAIPDLAMLSTDARVRENGARLGFALLPA